MLLVLRPLLKAHRLDLLKQIFRPPMGITLANPLHPDKRATIACHHLTHPSDAVDLLK